MKLRAIVHPSRAPTWQRRGWYGASAIALFFGGLMLNTFPSAPTLLAVAVLLWLVAPLVLRRSPYRAEIETAPGELRVRPRIGLPFRIETRTLTGASMAMIGEAPVVSVAERGGSPTSFELERGAGTDDLRRVLGVPSGGFGELRWNYSPRPLELFAFVARMLGALALLVVTVVPGALVTDAGASAALVVGLAALLVLVDTFANGRLLAMSPNGVAWIDEVWSELVPYREIERIEDDRAAIKIVASNLRTFDLPCAPTRLVRSGLREGERRVMVAQLQDAVRRAKGRARVDEAIAYADELARGFTSTTEWIARLDAMAASTIHAPAGYRGSTIPIGALWRILEDHDANPAARAAAARILSRSLGETTVARIDEAIASTHDASARSLMRAVLGEDAREVLEEIERQARLAGEIRS